MTRECDLQQYESSALINALLNLHSLEHQIISFRLVAESGEYCIQQYFYQIVNLAKCRRADVHFYVVFIFGLVEDKQCILGKHS